MEKIIDISNWEKYNDLEKAQLEYNAYQEILHLFISDNKVSTENNQFKYYENKYLEANYNLTLIKNEFEEYLRKSYPELNNLTFDWQVSFLRKKCTIIG